MRVARVLVMRNVASLYDYQIPEGWVVSIGTYVQVPMGPTVVEGLVMSFRVLNLSPHARPHSEALEDAPRMDVGNPDPSSAAGAGIQRAEVLNLSPHARPHSEALEDAPRMDVGNPDPSSAAGAGIQRAEPFETTFPSPSPTASDLETGRFRGKLRAISTLLEKRPLSPDIVNLITWLGETYICSPYVAYQTVVGTRKYRETPESEMSAIAEGHVLTEAQITVLSAMRARKGYHSWLVHGVTASGKTEIYMQLASDIIAEGKQVLFLVPEIGLTPQLRARVEERFGQRCVVMHSGQTPKQRDLAWSKALSGQAAIVVGPRSAVFAPVPRLGAIILDEEHDGSYKQDSNPRYWTHDVAAFRCRQSDAPLILGSATPRLETRYQAQIGESSCVTMPYRANRNPMPPIICVDSREDPNMRVGGIFSEPLDTAIRLRLAKGEKTILLLNRRGYAPYVGCQVCQTIYACSQCGLSMTYHKDRVFRCHRCYVTAPATLQCPSCKKPRLGYMGLGIQKVEAELIKHFPDSRIMRADRDSATTPKQLEKILSDFDREGDILIGTQLVAKGHHFEGVTLVGVLGIDTALNLQDFRAPERVYQLLVQVAGRAGRGSVPGEVMVQTAQPDHYALDCAVRQDDVGFYQQELSFREELTYPPFCRLLNIVYSGPVFPQVEAAAEKDAEHLMPLVLEGFTVFPPVSCPVDKVQDRYRWHILVKFAPDQEALLRMQLAGLPVVHRNIRRIIDMDPVSLL